MQRSIRGILIPAVVAGLLWLASGFVHVIAGSSVYAGRALRLVAPSPTNAAFWSWPAPWSAIALLLAALCVGALVFAFSAVFARAGRGTSFAGLWLSTVAAGAAVGLVIDGIGVLGAMTIGGWRAIATSTVEFAVVGAYWGLVQGWIPALIARRRRDNDAPSIRTAWPLAAAAAAIVLFVVGGVAGREAERTASLAEQALAEGFTPDDGAIPDPAAPGSPPPTVASETVERQPEWCTPEEAMPLLGRDDAATGHRGLSIRMMNFSDQPCVVEGYPDIAFADQNGNALDVTVEHGGSFMAQDAGPMPVEIPAGGHAIAVLGWNANSTHGALVARALFAAQAPGDERGSWPVELDIVAGSSVAVTAWAIDHAGPAADANP